MKKGKTHKSAKTKRQASPGAAGDKQKGATGGANRETPGVISATGGANRETPGVISATGGANRETAGAISATGGGNSGGATSEETLGAAAVHAAASPAPATAGGFPSGAAAGPEGWTADGERIGVAGSMKRAVPLLAAAGVVITLDLLKVAKNAGAPGFDPSGRVDCDVVRGWLEDSRNQQTLNSPVARKAIAEARHEEAKLERTEFRNGVEQGKFIERRAIADRLLKLSADQVTTLRQKIENEFPTRAQAIFGAGEDPAVALETFRAACRKVVDDVHAQMGLLVRDWTEEVAT